MESQNLNGAYKILHFRLLDKVPVQNNKLSFLKEMKYLKKKRNLVVFSIVYGTILGGIVCILLNA